LLRPASRLCLDPWIEDASARLSGLVLNVGSGQDGRLFGSQTIRVDAYAPRVSVRADISAALPFLDSSFDALLCTEVLEHLPNPTQALIEMRRVMKPGGVGLFTVPFVFHYHPDPGDFQRFTPEGLRAALVRAGFTVEFLAGVGGKFVALLMLVESINLVLKVLVRALLLPFRPILARRQPADGRWSDYASNVVAVVRVPADAHH